VQLHINHSYDKMTPNSYETAGVSINCTSLLRNDFVHIDLWTVGNRHRIDTLQLQSTKVPGSVFPRKCLERWQIPDIYQRRKFPVLSSCCRKSGCPLRHSSGRSLV